MLAISVLERIFIGIAPGIVLGAGAYFVWRLAKWIRGY